MTAVTETLEELELEVRTDNVSGGAVAVEAVDRRSLYRRLAANRPNRVEGWVEPVPTMERTGDGLRFCLHLTFASDYRAVVVTLWVCWVFGLAYLVRATRPESGWGGPDAAVVLAAGLMGVLGLLACGLFLLRVLGGGWMGQILWEPILRRIETSGGRVEPEATGVGRRYLSWTGGYGLSLFLCAILAVTSTELESADRLPPPLVGLLAGLLAVVVVLSITALAIAFWRGLGVRAGAVVLGLAGPLFMVFLLALPLPLALTQEPTALLLASRDEDLVSWSRLLLGEIVVVGGTGASLAQTMVRAAVPGRSQLRRTHRHRGRPGIYRDGVRGGRLLVILRLLFAASALGLGVIVLGALGISLAWAVQAVVPVWGGSLLRLPELSGPLLAAALGLAHGHPAVDAVARSTWVLWAGGAWGLLMVSVGQLGWERRRCRRSLMARCLGSARSEGGLVARLKERLRRAAPAKPPVRLSVAQAPAIAAHAHRFAGPRGAWFVEVTTGALDRLSPEELEALLAHELSHLVRGHVLRHDLARWLGRIAFLGDGFCRGLLDSFRWECEADEDVVLRWEISSEALIGCLRKVAAVNSQAGVRASAALAFCDRVVDPPDADGRPPGEGTWAHAWKLFREQYFHAGRLQYWHPDTDERIARIRSLCPTPPARRGTS